MICPHCSVENKLTWARYMSAPFSRFCCKACSLKFKLKRPLWYWLIPVALWATIFSGGVGIIYFMVEHSDYGVYAKPSVVVLISISMLVYVLIDKHIESGFSTIRL